METVHGVVAPGVDGHGLLWNAIATAPTMGSGGDAERQICGTAPETPMCVFEVSLQKDVPLEVRING